MRKVAAAVIVIVLASIPAGCAYFSGKTVALKNAPNQLIATDGSTCVVSKERFRTAEVGMKVLCGWRGGRIDPSQRRAP